MITPTNINKNNNPSVIGDDCQLTSKASSVAVGMVSFYDSVCGTTHPKNEDSVKIAPPFYGLADGVGGGASGDVASETLLNTCSLANMAKLNDEGSLQSLIYQADIDIKNKLSHITNKSGASTLVGVWLDEHGEGFYTWVGDARIYQIDIVGQSVNLTQLTLDHTYGNVRDTVPEGWQADDPAYMIGIGQRVVGKPKRVPVKIEQGQGLLLCSDGVHKFIPHDKLCMALEELIALHGLPLAIEKYAANLVKLAVELDSYDDCSALIVYNTGKIKQYKTNTESERTPINDESIKTPLDLITPTEYVKNQMPVKTQTIAKPEPQPKISKNNIFNLKLIAIISVFILVVVTVWIK